MLEVKLLKKEYLKTEQFYKDFLDGNLLERDDYFTEESVYLDEAPDFPIYLHTANEARKIELFFEAFDVLSNYYLETDRDIHFNEMFWYSLFCVYKRDYLISQYPEIKDNIKYFHNIVLKKFDWENYVYKCILGAQYIKDNVSEEEREKYYHLIVENLDLYNYIIKYEIFRNDKFLINVLDIIHDRRLGKILKAKIKGRDDLGKDERVGRRVIFEFNKSYPIVMSPMMSKEELEVLFLQYLSLYADLSNIYKG